MKPFIEHLKFDGKSTYFLPKDGKLDREITMNIAFEMRKCVDEYIIKKIFEKYKDTPIAEVYVLDENEFEKFLAKMLPIYMKGELK